ncbi:MAG: LPS export ABC transporter permease LptG [Gammaproteobacteria bacterium]|nr:MAG: LPS export ABC transporter permease LptG [Gammaproteobacteria bacterium]
MRLLDRYLVRQVLTGCLLALLALLLLDAVMAFIYEATSHDDPRFGAYQAFLYVLYTLPRRLYEYFPTGILIGGMLSLGALAAHSELIAMRAAGVSINRIARSALKAGVLLMLAVFLVGEFVAPVAERKADGIKLGDRAAVVKGAEGRGLWFRQGNDFIRIREILPERVLQGVHTWTIDPEQGRVIANLRAARAHYMPTKDAWVLEGVVESRWQGERLVISRHPRLQVANLLDPQLFRVLTLRPENMSLRDLSRYTRYLKQNHLDAARYELAFWTRFSTPLSSLVMLMVALPFVFSSRRSGGFGQQLFLGIVIGIVFFLLNRMLNHVGLVYHLPPVLAAFLPLLLFAGAAGWALRRIR